MRQFDMMLCMYFRYSSPSSTLFGSAEVRPVCLQVSFPCAWAVAVALPSRLVLCYAAAARDLLCVHLSLSGRHMSRLWPSSWGPYKSKLEVSNKLAERSQGGRVSCFSTQVELA